MAIDIASWANIKTCPENMWCGNGSFCESDDQFNEHFVWPRGNVLGLAGEVNSSSSDSTSSTPANIGNSSSNNTTSPQGTCLSNVNETVSGGIPLKARIEIGVGVGIPLAIAAISFAALWLLERKRRSRVQTMLQTVRDEGSRGGNSEASSQDVQRMAYQQLQPSELGESNQIPELQSNRLENSPK